MTTPLKLWVGASSIHLSDNWLYVHVLMWIDNLSLPEEEYPIHHKIVYKDGLYVFNDEESRRNVVGHFDIMRRHMERKYGID